MSISKGIFTTNQPAPQRLHLLLPNNNQISQKPNHPSNQTLTTTPNPPTHTSCPPTNNNNNNNPPSSAATPNTSKALLRYVLSYPQSPHSSLQSSLPPNPFPIPSHILTTLPTVRHRCSNRLRNLERLSRNRQSRRYRRDESRKPEPRCTARWIWQG